ncbi:hypothetical protein LZ30DRAFT_214255 [Colletotrichum cereale]|nr:hypothetical protein LZ30DRAFT_214255 [Colletotrichum cereale]
MKTPWGFVLTALRITAHVRMSQASSHPKVAMPIEPCHCYSCRRPGAASPAIRFPFLDKLADGGKSSHHHHHHHHHHVQRSKEDVSKEKQACQKAERYGRPDESSFHQQLDVGPDRRLPRVPGGGGIVPGCLGADFKLPFVVRPKNCVYFISTNGGPRLSSSPGRYPERLTKLVSMVTSYRARYLCLRVGYAHGGGDVTKNLVTAEERPYVSGKAGMEGRPFVRDVPFGTDPLLER